MKQQASFTGWDFWGNSDDGSADLWFMPTDAYPVFPWQTDITGLREVPIVAGLDRQDAIVVLEDAGFGVHEREESCRTIAAGQVVRTDPCSASYAPIGSTVDLFVSVGPYDWSTNPGDGTAEAPYQVGTVGQLESLVDHPELWDKHFVLTADVDMDPNLRVVWPGPGKALDCPIAESFSGTWDGAGHRITNLTMNSVINSPSANAYRGLVGQISPAGIVQALTIERTSITAERQGNVKRGHDVCLGALAGWNGGTILDCHITAIVRGPAYSPSIGGMVGSNAGQISRRDALGSANTCGGGSYAGGLAGDNSGTIIDCQASASVLGDGDHCGGLVGYNSGVRIPMPVDPRFRSLTVQDSDTGVIINCRATGDVSGRGISQGGLVGSCSGGNISHSYATRAVLGGNDAGGLVGHASQAEIVDCYATGAVVGDDYGASGGLVGKNDLSIITHSYSTGQVSSLSNTHHPVGGLVGQELYDADVVACSWDIETSGQTLSAGGTGLTTAEMMDVNTYLLTGWDFAGETANGTEDIWVMPIDPAGYPRLAWEFASPD
jgi:hypothetical protein